MGAPYTYLIGWSKLDRWYYGVRYAKTCDQQELWESYFTSSKHVKRFRENNGEPDVIQIRKTFDNAETAIEWESKVLKRLNVINTDRWLNRTDNKSISIEACKFVHTDAISLKKSLSHIGKKHSEETKAKIRESSKNKNFDYLIGVKKPEHSKKMSGGNNPKAQRLKYQGQVYSTFKELIIKTGFSYREINKLITTKTIEKLGSY